MSHLNNIKPSGGKCSLIPSTLIIKSNSFSAYEKAGFRYLKTVQVTGEDEPEYIMRVGKEAAT
ncbi:MAG: hypothetical protein AUG51_04820 [Acidobacteria bacterium 13_1_20CM_3_53_8]|nr:MAG: hypothetical protein AUG51_04820 [Acidobacteria bacterium 13_1_20CM_3_53_8]